MSIKVKKEFKVGDILISKYSSSLDERKLVCVDNPSNKGYPCHFENHKGGNFSMDYLIKHFELKKIKIELDYAIY